MQTQAKISLARLLRRNSTEAERKLWSKLRAGRFDGFPFKRQYPCGPYILDFACVSQKLNIELDGSQHADSKSDQVRDAFLMQQGWRVQRFWNKDLQDNFSGVLETIRNALLQPAPSLTLPRTAGEGMEIPTPTPGRYRHYKGNEYEVLGTAQHTETLEPMVVYRALYGEQGLWVRPAGMFMENVTIEGITQPRFTLLPK